MRVCVCVCVCTCVCVHVCVRCSSVRGEGKSLCACESRDKGPGQRHHV